MQMELTWPLKTDFSSFLLTILVAIIAPMVPHNYLFGVVGVAILLASVRCEIRQPYHGVEDHGQPHHGLSFTHQSP